MCRNLAFFTLLTFQKLLRRRAPRCCWDQEQGEGGGGQMIRRAEQCSRGLPVLHWLLFVFQTLAPTGLGGGGTDIFEDNRSKSLSFTCGCSMRILMKFLGKALDLAAGKYESSVDFTVSSCTSGTSMGQSSGSSCSPSKKGPYFLIWSPPYPSVASHTSKSLEYLTKTERPKETASH